MLELKKKILARHKSIFLKGKGSTLSLGEYFDLKVYLKKVEGEINSIILNNDYSWI